MNNLPAAAYIGPNAAHKKFHLQLACEKVFFYALTAKNVHHLETIHNDFAAGVRESEEEAAKKEERGSLLAIGTVTDAHSPSSFGSLVIPINEAHRVAANYGEFKWLFFTKIYTEVYRIFETYLVDLLGEIYRRRPQILKRGRNEGEKTISHSDVIDIIIAQKEQAGVALLEELIQRRQRSHRSYDAITAEFAFCGLPIIGSDAPDAADIAQRLKELGATRNVIEHNNGKADAEYLRIVQNSKVSIGDKITVGTREIGYVISGSEHVAEALNKRAVDKFGLTG